MNNFTDPNEKEASSFTKLNPFISAWLHPKQTARYMIDAKSIGYAILLLSIGYIGSLLAGVTANDLPIWGIILICLILSPIVGIIGTAISAAIFLLVGKLFKGTGIFSDLFKALSLNAIPFIVLIPFYIILLIISPESLIITDFEEALPWTFWATNFVTIGISIWSLVITVGAVAEAHRFSNWKAFFTILIPMIVFGLIMFAIIAVIIVSILSVATI
ncbi:MAG: Yip1 family protein [Solibacillus sp.]